MEVIGPELQSIYDDRQIEVSLFVLYPFVSTSSIFVKCYVRITLDVNVLNCFAYKQIEFVDMHFGTGPNGAVVDNDPYVLQDHLREIEMCSKVSKSVFFIVSTLDVH